MEKNNQPFGKKRERRQGLHHLSHDHTANTSEPIKLRIDYGSTLIVPPGTTVVAPVAA